MSGSLVDRPHLIEAILVRLVLVGKAKSQLPASALSMRSTSKGSSILLCNLEGGMLMRSSLTQKSQSQSIGPWDIVAKLLA